MRIQGNPTPTPPPTPPTPSSPTPAPAPSATPSRSPGQLGAFLNGLFGRNPASLSNRSKLQWIRQSLFHQSAPTPTTPTQPDITLQQLLQSPRGPYMLRILGILAMIFGASTILANVMAAKVWHIGPINLDGGFFLFGAVYVTGDILVALYGDTISDHLAAWVAGLNLVIFALFWIVDKLPGVPGVANLNFTLILGMSGRILIASAIGFLISRKLNNRIFSKLAATAPAITPTDVKAQRMLTRTQSAVSSFIGRIADTVLFTIIAFFGRLGFGLMLQQILGSFLAGWLFEAILRRLVTVPAIEFLRTKFNAAGSTAQP